MLKVEAAQALTEEEKRLYESHPEVAGKLLAAIPRLEEVAAIVTAQFGAISFAGRPDDVRKWDIRSTGQLLLRTSLEFDRLTARGTSRDAAVQSLSKSDAGAAAGGRECAAFASRCASGIHHSRGPFEGFGAWDAPR